MSKYLNALGESSAGTAKVDSMNAAFVDQTSSFNAKLRNIHSEVMGATDPVGLGFVAKGVGKIGSKVVDRVATKSLQNINEQMTAITDKGAARLAGLGAPSEEPIDVQTGLTADESSQLDNLVSQSKLAGNFTSSTETAITPNEPAATTVTDGVETGTKSVAATSTEGAADTAASNAAADTSVGATESGTIAATATEASTETTLASTTAASAADDWNPIGIVTTIGLGLATLFAGIFGHKKEQVARHVQSLTLNPSTQFGV